MCLKCFLDVEHMKNIVLHYLIISGEPVDVSVSEHLSEDFGTAPPPRLADVDTVHADSSTPSALVQPSRGSPGVRAAGQAVIAVGRMHAARGEKSSPKRRPAGSGPTRSGQQFLEYRSAIRQLEPVVPAHVAKSVVVEDV